MKNIQAHNIMRKSLSRVVHLFVPLILVSGFFVAGISGGSACNTYPWVGCHWFYTKNHFNADIPFWQNFSENKLVAQVNHRTLATALTLVVSYKTLRLLGIRSLTPQAKLASALLFGALWMQLGIGVKTIWEGTPIQLASTHQIGAMTVLSSFLFAMHTCRKVDGRHLKNLIGKMKLEDPERFKKMTSSYNASMLSKRQYEEIKQQYVGPKS